MRTRELGNSGQQWTLLGLGSWAIGGPWARGWGAQDDADSRDAIHRALDAGVNWIDTAAVYGRGHAEVVIAEALAERPADASRPLVLTKCGREEMPDGSVRSVGAAEAVRRSALESVERLGVDRLDMMQMHWPPTDVPIEETWTAIAELKRDGTAATIGACNIDLAQLRVLERIERPDLVQVPVSLVRREALAELIPYCREQGIGVLAYAPMQSGLLTGKYDAERIAALPEGDWRRTDPEFGGEKLARNLQIVEALRAIASRRGCSVGEAAIAWVLAQSGVTGAIVGARSAAQVDGWLGAEAVALDEADLQRLAEALTAPVTPGVE